MKMTLFALLFGALMTVAAGTAPGSQSFEANKFLDMLGRSFDPKVAYIDLLAELTQRLNIDVNSTSTNNSLSALIGSKLASPGKDKPACQEAPKVKGTMVTYTSEAHVVGSRAFYECDTGYDGMSKFIYCTQGGQWSTTGDWQGCTPVDCGVITPNVKNADPAFTSTTYGSLVFYTCQTGYKMDKSNANISCLDTGLWDKPNFACQKGTSPSLRLPSLQKAFNKNIGVQKIQQLQQLATTLLEATPAPVIKPAPPLSPPAPPLSPPAPLAAGAMMEAFFKSMQAFSALAQLPKTEPASPVKSPAAVPNANMFANNPMAMLAQMFPNFAPPPPTTTTTTTTTARPPVRSHHNGFELPGHLQSLIPNGLQSASGIKPQDLMALAAMGLGSSNPAAAPRDITQLLGGMNPMSIFGGSMGLGGMGGMGGMSGGGGAGAGGARAAAAPVEPEVVAEQQEQMMMRAMMASAMKSMMSPGGARNGTAAPARNPTMDMMTMMALQNGLNGGNQASGGGGGSAMDPLSMMMGMGGGGGGGGGAGLLASLFGA